MDRIVAGGLLVLALAAPTLGADELRDSRKAFLAARSAVADGRYQQALELYRRVLEKIPDDAVVRLEYAQLLRDLNVAEEALTQAREAVRLDPGLPEARRLLGAMELASAERDPTRLAPAIEELTAARRLAPGDIATAVSLARALLAAGRAAEAAEVLDDLPELRSQPSIRRLEAEAKARSGRLREAEEIYRSLLETDPSDREIAAALIDLYEDEDRLDDALVLLERLHARDPENPAVSERIVLDLARAGRFEEAEKRARDLLGRRPENRAGRRLLAQILFERGNTTEGETILRGLLEVDPEDFATRRFLASELARERRFEEATKLLEETQRRAGEDARKAEAKQTATVELGFVAFLKKDWPETRRLLNPIAVSSSGVQDRAARILLAAERESEDFAGGLARARTLAAAEPDNAEWTATLAEFRFRSGETREAEERLEELARSGELEKMLAAADAWARLKRFGDSARVAREASAKSPERAEALFRLGSSLERGGDSTEAEKAFLRLLELRPNDAAAQNYLGYMWADRGVQLERARAMLEKAVAREPRNPAYLDSLGWVYFRLGRLEEAGTNLREAHRREPTDATIEEHMGDLEMRLGDAPAALAHWEKALSLKHEEPDKVREKIRRGKPSVSRR